MLCKRVQRLSCKNHCVKVLGSRWLKRCGKGTPVIGGNVGEIRYQIEDRVNGFLVSSIDETAERMVEVINDKELRNEMGRAARETVRKNFLLTRYLEQYLDLFGEL
jgi:trehalose synthase